MEIDGGRISPRLTTIELNCILLLAEGHSKASIAAKLRLNDVEAADHFHTAFQKLGTQNPTHAVALALYFGLIEPSNDD
ncbi:hypothetical protein GCM10011390_10510 [Aureimonas endophytica]|uniref:HTH luxR-type domain-containing protein n=1 Tax=Aureimonas endophytica TaxID=2027858 RepID=A0A917E1T5_9HYPH|nr:hypothetical protein GCM10011390_10510 [Aureimonas endophytica]